MPQAANATGHPGENGYQRLREALKAADSRYGRLPVQDLLATIKAPKKRRRCLWIRKKQEAL